VAIQILSMPSSTPVSLLPDQAYLTRDANHKHRYCSSREEIPAGYEIERVVDMSHAMLFNCLTREEAVRMMNA